MSNLNRDYYSLKKNTYQKNLTFTIQFYTGGHNKVYDIQFYIVFQHLEYRLNYYTRYIQSVQRNDLTQSTDQTSFTNYFLPQFRYSQRWFSGISGFNFTKQGKKKVYVFPVTSTQPIKYTLSSSGNTATFVNIDLSIFAIFDTECTYLQKYQPSTYNCVSTCPANYYPDYSTSLTVCKQCHYSCLTCNGYENTKCLTCKLTDFRGATVVTNGTLKTCPCQAGYFDNFVSTCLHCSNYIWGCISCIDNATCTACDNSYAVLYQKKCYCSDSTKFLTPTGCNNNRIQGCQLHVVKPGNQIICTECYVERGYTINSNFKCDCDHPKKFQVDFLSPHKQMYCVFKCGDGYVSPNEQCDDGNIVTGDGCDNLCIIEQYFTCTNTTNNPSNCIFSEIIRLQLFQSQRILYKNTAVLNFTIFPYYKYLDQILDYAKITVTSLPYSKLSAQYYCNPHEILPAKCYLAYTIDYTNHLQNNIFFLLLNLSATSNASFGHANIKYDSNATYFLPKGNIAQISLQTWDDLEKLQDMQIIFIVFVVISLLITLISLPIQKMVGVELIMTIQFMYYILTQIQNNPVQLCPIEKYVKYSNGYNNLNNYTYYSYAPLSNQINHIFYQKEFFLNMNIMFALLLIVSIGFVIFKIYRILIQPTPSYKSLNYKQQEQDEIKLVKYRKIHKVYCNQVFFFYVFFVMNQVIFNSLISFDSQTPNILLIQWLNFLGVLIGLLIVTLTIYSLVYWYQEINDKNKNKKNLFIPYSFENCKNQYILLYAFIQPFKMLILSIFFTFKFGLYLILTIQVLYFIILFVYKPYKQKQIKQSSSQYSYSERDPQAICISIHNFGICFNQFILILFCILCIVWNQAINNYNFDNIFPNLILYFTLVFIICLDIVAILRLLYKKLGKLKLFQGATTTNQNDYNNKQALNKMRKLLKEQDLKKKQDSQYDDQEKNDSKDYNKDKKDKMKLYHDIRKSKQHFIGWKQTDPEDQKSDQYDYQKQGSQDKYDVYGNLIKPYNLQFKRTRPSKYVQMQTLTQGLNSSRYNINKSSQKKNAQLNHSVLQTLLQRKQQQFYNNQRFNNKTKQKNSNNVYDFSNFNQRMVPEAEQQQFLYQVKQKLKQELKSKLKNEAVYINPNNNTMISNQNTNNINETNNSKINNTNNKKPVNYQNYLQTINK